MTDRKYRHVACYAAVALYWEFSLGLDDPIFPYDFAAKGETSLFSKAMLRGSRKDHPPEVYRLREACTLFAMEASSRMEAAYWPEDTCPTREIPARAGLEDIPSYTAAATYGILRVDGLEEVREVLGRAKDRIIEASNDLTRQEAREVPSRRYMGFAPARAEWKIAKAHGFYMLDYINAVGGLMKPRGYE